jgi:pimeloyl-ACP methyl ester carboxylesterase
MRGVEIGGLTISYGAGGGCPPLALLHAGLADRREWHEQFAALSDEFTVYAWDAAGCRLSNDPPESRRMPDFAEAVVAWLAAVGVRRPHLLGLSWGRPSRSRCTAVIPTWRR